MLLFMASSSTVSAYALEVDPTPVTIPQVSPDNDYFADIDALGNQFLLYNYVSPRQLRKITPDGTVAWTVTFPVISASHPKRVPDNLGGMYYVYDTSVSRPGIPINVNNIFVLHYDSNGTYDAQNVQVIPSALYQVVEAGFVDQAGTLFLLYSERQFGDSYSKNLSFKVARVNSAGVLQNTPTTKTLNPTESRWCTNRGASTEVPYDLPYAGGVMWSACWSWCQAEFATTPGTCQYNADGVRSCWVNAFPAGGVGNCVWEDFSPGRPPYSGYFGITQTSEATVSETFYEYQVSDNIGTSLSIYEIKPVADGFLMVYAVVETDYGAGTPTTVKQYVQKLNTSGVPQLAGWGTEITTNYTLSSGDFNFASDGWFFTYAVDTDADTRTDTIRVQRYDTSGTPQFAGSGVDVFTYVEANTDLYAFTKNRGSGIALVIEAWNDTVPASGNVEKVFMQAIDGTGALLLGANGVQIAEYTDTPEPEYTWDVFDDGNGGILVPIMYTIGTVGDPLFRVFWLDSEDQVHYVQQDGLSIDVSAGSPTCSGNAAGNTMCLIENAEVANQIFKFSHAYQITTAGGLKVLSSNGNEITSGSDYGIGPTFASYEDTVTVQDSDNDLVFQSTASVSTDRDWSTVTGASDLATKKSFAHDVITAPGAALTYELLIPREAGDDGVFVCPDVISLVAVTEGCTDGVLFGNAETRDVTFASGVAAVTSSQVTLNTQPYWKLSGMKGSGALSVLNSPTPSPTDTPTDTPTPTPTDTPTPSDTPTDTPTASLTATASPTTTALATATATSTTTTTGAWTGYPTDTVTETPTVLGDSPTPTDSLPVTTLPPTTTPSGTSAFWQLPLWAQATFGGLAVVVAWLLILLFRKRRDDEPLKKRIPVSPSL